MALVPRSEAVVALAGLAAFLLGVPGCFPRLVELLADAVHGLLGLDERVPGIGELGVEVGDRRLGCLRRGDRVLEFLLGLGLLGGLALFLFALRLLPLGLLGRRLARSPSRLFFSAVADLALRRSSARLRRSSVSGVTFDGAPLSSTTPKPTCRRALSSRPSRTASPAAGSTSAASSVSRSFWATSALTFWPSRSASLAADLDSWSSSLCRFGRQLSQPITVEISRRLAELVTERQQVVDLVRAVRGRPDSPARRRRSASATLSTGSTPADPRPPSTAWQARCE